jgi:twinkle protein
VVAQKLRYKDKSSGMPWRGDPKDCQLFGQHLQGSGKAIFVTEGELDAMSVSQALGNRWPAVSVINGASGAARDLLRHQAWLRGFERIFLCLDNDEAGQKAAQECARALQSFPVHLVTLPLKDASDMVVAGRVEELVRCLWGGTRWKPKGILEFSEIRSKVHERPTTGVAWPFGGLSALTYGRRPGELVASGAGVGVGKTDWLASCQALDITTLRLNTAIFTSEQTPEEALKAICSKVAGQRFNVPDGGWTKNDLEAALDLIAEGGKLAIYDRSEDFSWPTIRDHIRYLAEGEGYKSFYLDNLTACVAHADDERRTLDALMEELAGLTVKLGLYTHVVSHLTTPDGRPHEEGGRVFAKHFTGSRSIARWCNYMFGLERDTQAEGPDERRRTTLRILKDRYTGMGTGKTIPLLYDEQTGLMSEDHGYGSPEQGSSAVF